MGDRNGPEHAITILMHHLLPLKSKSD